MAERRHPAGESSGFDPAVVAKFFQTIGEMNQTLIGLQRSVDLNTAQTTVLIQDIKAINRELSEGNARFSSHDEQIKTLSCRMDHKDLESQNLRTISQDLSTRITAVEAKGAGIGIFGKFLIGVGALTGTAATIGLILWKLAESAAKHP